MKRREADGIIKTIGSIMSFAVKSIQVFDVVVMIKLAVFFGI